MAEGKEKKKKASSSAASGEQAQRARDLTSGEMLRTARLERKLGLEEISASIHIRVAQLRALEEGNIEALPGMTYALGFARSYATFLKINSAEVVNKFKTEHGAMKPQMPELSHPVQSPENRMPDPMVAGVAAFCAILLLVLYTVFSGGDDEIETVASVIPPAPVVQLAGDTMAPVIAAFPGSETKPVVPTGNLTGTNLLTGTATPVAPTDMPPLETVLGTTPAPVAGEIQASAVTLPLAMPKAKPEAPVIAPATTPLLVEGAAPPAEVINVKRGKSRITIRATEQSWVQVDDARRHAIYKRVMKPGEQFSVPDEAGMTMITSNAGGVILYVDGKKQAALGGTGEIVRGVVLEPGRLNARRSRVSNY